MRSILLLFITSILVFSVDSNAQTAKKVVAEHFTNTVCGICANRNPDLWGTLALESNSEVLHIAYHPSSPYPSCLLNQHNVSENDGRVMYYQEFGATPKLMVNGTNLISSTNFSNANLFNPYHGAESPLKIIIEQFKYADEITIDIRVANSEAHTLSDLVLFAAVAEDTIFYNSPNGESEHHNVFRKAFTSIDGDPITLGTAANDESSYSFTIPVDSDWDYNRIYSYVIVQSELNRSIVQAEAASPSQNDVVISITDFEDLGIQAYPNPVNDILNFDFEFSGNETFNIYDAEGSKIISGQTLSENKINLSGLNTGIYFIEINSADNSYTKKIIKN